MKETINEVIQKAAKVRKLTDHQILIVERMTQRTADLLTNHFKSIESVREDNTTATANVNISFILGYDNGAGYVKTKIRFMRSYKDEAEDTIGDPNQRDWVEETGEDKIPPAPTTEKPTKPAKKAKK